MNEARQSMFIDKSPPAYSAARRRIAAAYLEDEAVAIERLLSAAAFDGVTAARITERARTLVEVVRRRAAQQGGIDAFLREYDLSSQEGVVLMCLAEALLRIPDAATADRLIREKLSQADWARHLGHSGSLFVNAGTWGLMLTGRLVQLDAQQAGDVAAILGRMAARSGEPVVRAALKEAMRILGHQFVMGRTIEDALKRSRTGDNARYRYSFDMLGEAALTAVEAERYFSAYDKAVAVLAADVERSVGVAMPGISIKLSALHARFECAQRERVRRELAPRVVDLVARAARAGLRVTLDTEEADRLEITLDVFESLLREPSLSGYEGLGLAVQAYQKRALHVIDWLTESSRAARRRITVRLVKGAYWDTEIKRAQERGLADYPVFTRKVNTDVSYLACVARLFAAADICTPQFATHNAHTAAAVIEMAGRRAFEFQRLHGMGEALYETLMSQAHEPVICGVYAPVGEHAQLLPYLVRRLLENGANTSFINRLEDLRAPIETLIGDPVGAAQALDSKSHPGIPRPIDLYQPQRRNSAGIDFSDWFALETLAGELKMAAGQSYRAVPTIGHAKQATSVRTITSPADHSLLVGEVIETDAVQVSEAFRQAADAAAEWAAMPVDHRATIMARAADLIEARRAELMLLCIREGGRTLPDALAEVREAADYGRYYGALARRLFEQRQLPGPTGERNYLALYGRGVFACISPWNFPLAIFAGQVMAALIAGNAVVAKPARQTPLVAARLVALLKEAGVPPPVLHCVPGASGVIGPALIGDPQLAGVVFTGSTESARAIHRALAARNGAILPLIAETGGINAMIVDSSALPEQVVHDVLQSAFNSAGQRCSALRVLYLQREIADHVIAMLQGAMAELRVGDPALLATDVGPVIDAQAKKTLDAYIASMRSQARLLAEATLPPETACGSFVAPVAFEIEHIGVLPGEVFGPVLHVVRYAADRLDGVIEAVNHTGYGLTLGIHSRIEATAEYIRARVRVGNVYVNRNMIGAVVGVQPFGGEGLSGTGPKAGGPNYLQHFAVERSYTENTAAIGGNTGLLLLGD